MLTAVGASLNSNESHLVILEGSMLPAVRRLLNRSTPLLFSDAVFYCHHRSFQEDKGGGVYRT